jgi:hypothetical protein
MDGWSRGAAPVAVSLKPDARTRLLLRSITRRRCCDSDASQLAAFHVTLRFGRLVGDDVKARTSYTRVARFVSESVAERRENLGSNEVYFRAASVSPLRTFLAIMHSF